MITYLLRGPDDFDGTTISLAGTPRVGQLIAFRNSGGKYTYLEVTQVVFVANETTVLLDVFQRMSIGDLR